MGNPDRQLEDLLDRYAGLIRRIVRRVGGRATALVGEDIEQDIKLALWRRLQAG